MEPILVILREVAEGDDWAEAEREEIAKARASGWPLTNLTQGGEGAALTEEARTAKLAIMGKPETRAKMKAAANAKWEDPEKAKRLRAAISSPEARENYIASARRRATPEYRAKMAEKSKAAWANPDKRARIESGITDEVKAAVSAASKRFWATSPKAAKCKANLLSPTREMIEKATAARLTPEALARRREWSSSPEHRAKLSAALKASWERRKRKA